MLKKIFLSMVLIVLGVLSITVYAVSAKGLDSLPDAALEHMSDKALSHIPVCVGSSNGIDARCHSRVVTDGKGQPQAAPLPSGFGPTQFKGAYNLNNLNSTQTIAIVDAYDHPNIKADLDQYDSTFGLPAFPNCSATITTGCFQKVDQRGGTKYPAVNAGWAMEIALDVEVAHGMCTNCKILLVEADSNSFADLISAEERAVALGAKIISNSWGGGEFSTETSASYDGHFNKPGVMMTFSSGDAGYGVEYPAASPYVTAVGGTTLTMNGNNYTSESAWTGAGSGCSQYEQKPAFQTLLNLTGCTHRTVADVSADADPNSGAAVYDSVKNQGKSGWFKVGGTSLASPIIAATYALAGNASTITNAFPYAHALSNLHDILTGNNGSCAGSYLCTAKAGYDGPTGLGSPIGTGAF